MCIYCVYLFNFVLYKNCKEKPNLVLFDWTVGTVVVTQVYVDYFNDDSITFP